MRTTTQTESKAKTAPKPPVDTRPPAEPVPGVNAFCDTCRHLGKDRRCHLMPPHTNNNWFSGRGEIGFPATEYCWQFKPSP